MSRELENSKISEAIPTLSKLLSNNKGAFWQSLINYTDAATTFNEMISLAAIRKKALKSGDIPMPSGLDSTLRIALIGGNSLYPLSSLLEHVVSLKIGRAEIFTGDFNNYRAEIVDTSSKLYQFNPDIVVLLPDNSICRYTGTINDLDEDIYKASESLGSDLFGLCSILQNEIGAETILCNYIPSPYFDLGPLRTRSLASDWNFKKLVNLYLGSKAPNFVHILDLEFLAYRIGGLASKDEKSFFESKQLCSPTLQVALAKEIVHIIEGRKASAKKVLVLDLDNTLWGGIIGDDGIDGIELGDTSPRGEAFKALQTYILSLTRRGLLLGICSKNDYENAIEPFRRHPEMVLREGHIVSFKANWKPKAQNLIEMANELNLGLESFVFVDDNPAEVENVRQFAPSVASILLGPDPSEYVRQLQDSRLFERSSITKEDLNRTDNYQMESARRSLLVSSLDMDSYLSSLEMVGTIKKFNKIDLPRITQLINKSNQFNLTTRRRSETELEDIMTNPSYTSFSLRLSDRFGDHGLISVVICRAVDDSVLEIDTWLMSCRVLNRQVEEVVFNEIVELGRTIGARKIKGFYKPTKKNSMVKDLYTMLGFDPVDSPQDSVEFELSIDAASHKATHISITGRE